jgi:hypothetical protein
MEKNEQESKEGLYEVYYTEEGKKLIVLEGLDPNDQFEPPLLQQKIHEHYDAIAVFYWILFGTVFMYLTGAYIVMPLFKRYRRYLRRN